MLKNFSAHVAIRLTSRLTILKSKTFCTKLFFRLNNHRGIIKLLDWSETDQYIILIMETSENYVDVMKFIEIKGRLTEKQAWSIFNQVSER